MSFLITELLNQAWWGIEAIDCTDMLPLACLQKIRLCVGNNTLTTYCLYLVRIKHVRFMVFFSIQSLLRNYLQFNYCKQMMLYILIWAWIKILGEIYRLKTINLEFTFFWRFYSSFLPQCRCNFNFIKTTILQCFIFVIKVNLC